MFSQLKRANGCAQVIQNAQDFKLDERLARSVASTACFLSSALIFAFTTCAFLADIVPFSEIKGVVRVSLAPIVLACLAALGMCTVLSWVLPRVLTQKQPPLRADKVGGSTAQSTSPPPEQVTTPGAAPFAAASSSDKDLKGEEPSDGSTRSGGLSTAAFQVPRRVGAGLCWPGAHAGTPRQFLNVHRKRTRAVAVQISGMVQPVVLRADTLRLRPRAALPRRRAHCMLVTGCAASKRIPLLK